MSIKYGSFYAVTSVYTEVFPETVQVASVVTAPIKSLKIIFRQIQFSEDELQKAKDADLELKGYIFKCPREQIRSPRIIRVGVFQNKIPLETWTPIKENLDSFYDMAKRVIEIAVSQKINIFCFQEAWSM